MEKYTLELLFYKLELIEKRLDEITDDIIIIKKGTSNMDTHISFVENIYDSIKYPFYCIINNFSTKKIEPQLKQIKFD